MSGITRREIGKIYISVGILGLLIPLWACNPSTNAQQMGNVQISGTFETCTMDSMGIYTIDGLALKPLLSAPIEKNGEEYSFELSGELPQKGIYFIGQAPRNLKGIVLGGEKDVEITGNCMDLPSFMKIENSPDNEVLATINQKIGELQAKTNRVRQQFRVAQSQDGQTAEMQKQLDEISEEQFAYKDSLEQADPFMAKLFAMNLQEVFDPNENPKNYPDEIHHFAGEMLAYADLSDPAYNYLPLSDYVRVYTPQLFGTTLSDEEAQTYLDQLLNRIPSGSPAHKNTLAAVVSTLEQMRASAFPVYAERYLEKYSPAPEVAQTIRQRIESVKELNKERAAQEKIVGIGATPPPIRLKQPNGEVFEWEKLSGKIVLLDFWASWCGPCRVENPNVVRVYQSYKDQGFEILGVSLDQDRSQWLQAIEKDNLSWEHVSDLNGWRSQAAQDYFVSAIPATFLLDREGKIIAKNLRGKQLEDKLAEILGP